MINLVCPGATFLSNKHILLLTFGLGVEQLIRWSLPFDFSIKLGLGGWHLILIQKWFVLDITFTGLWIVGEPQSQI